MGNEQTYLKIWQNLVVERESALFYAHFLFYGNTSPAVNLIRITPMMNSAEARNSLDFRHVSVDQGRGAEKLDHPLARHLSTLPSLIRILLDKR